MTTTLVVHLALTMAVPGLTFGVLFPGQMAFAAQVVGAVLLFSMANMGLGNLNAIALSPFRHVAGMASTAVIAAATVLAVGVAAPLGLMFDGTPVPLPVGVAVLLAAAILLMQIMPRDVSVISPSA